MKLSELKAPQMVSVAVKDGHDSFFKITFVISQKKKKHDLSHFWYVSKRPVIIRRPGKGGGGTLGRGGGTLGRGASWKGGAWRILSASR